MTFTENSSLATSYSLLGRATAGDDEAWQRIVQIYGPLVYGWARRSGLQPQDAADATQETFAAVASSLPKYDPHRVGATFRGWLWTIARNKAADLVRHQMKQCHARGGSTNLARLNAVNAPLSNADNALHQLPEQQDAQDDPTCANDRTEVIQRALAVMRTKFEPTTWRAFWRTVIDGLTPDEVAAELNLSRWAVYKARSRVLQCLRTELNGLERLD